MNLWGITDVGAVRSDNQDYYQIEWLSEDVVLAVVCDGMGGANAGNIASRVAGDCFVASVRADTVHGQPQGGQQWPQILERAAAAANGTVYAMSVANFEMRGMGTTLVAALITAAHIWVVNIGDSRCYAIESGSITQVSRDHSLVEALVVRGEITPAQARRHPKKNLITRSVGVDETVMADIFERPNMGGCLLLCSDGLSNALTDEQLCAAVMAEEKESCCRRLLDAALAAGATDNVTVILAQL